MTTTWINNGTIANNTNNTERTTRKDKNKKQKRRDKYRNYQQIHIKDMQNRSDNAATTKTNKGINKQKETNL